MPEGRAALMPRFMVACDVSSNDATCATKELDARRARDANRMNRYCTSPRARDTESSRTTKAPVLAAAFRCNDPIARRQRNRPTGHASRAGKRVSVALATQRTRRRSSTHESLTSDPKSRRRWPTADLAKRLLNNCTPRRRSTSSRRRSPQCEVCSPYRAVRMNTRAKFGWRDQTCVRRLTIARGSLSTAAEFGGASNHVPTRTTTRPQTPSRLTSRRYAGEPKLASRACSKLASRVLNYALILATLTPLSSWLTVAGRVLSAAFCGAAGRASHAGGGGLKYSPE